MAYTRSLFNMQRSLHDASPLIKKLLGRSEKPSRGAPVVFPNLAHAQIYTRGFKTNPIAMIELRQTLAHDLSPARVTRMRDDEVLSQVAWRLYTGHFAVTEERRALNVSGLGGRRPESAPFVEHPPQDVMQGFSNPAPRPVASQPTDEAEVDAFAQAATLMQAAREGTPFCEACAKAKSVQAVAA